MRKILSIFFLSIMLLSCGEEDDDNGIPRPYTIDRSILGKWELESCMRVSSAKYNEESGKYISMKIKMLNIALMDCFRLMKTELK